MSYEKAKSLMQRGLSRPALYQLEIKSNTNNASFSDDAREYLELFVKDISLPEISHTDIPVAGQDMVGVVRQQPAQVVYAKPLTFTVIERSDFVVYKEIKKWFDRTANGSNSKNESSHRMKYYDDIVCDLKLKKFEYSQHASPTSKFAYSIAEDLRKEGHMTDDGYRRSLVVNFRNAYPTKISDIAFGTEMQNQPVTYTVSMNYETYDTVVPDWFSTEHLEDFDQVVRDFKEVNGDG